MSYKRPLKVALAVSLVLAMAVIPLLGSGCVGGGPGAARAQSQARIGDSGGDLG